MNRSVAGGGFLSGSTDVLSYSSMSQLSQKRAAPMPLRPHSRRVLYLFHTRELPKYPQIAAHSRGNRSRKHGMANATVSNMDMSQGNGTTAFCGPRQVSNRKLPRDGPGSVNE